MNGTIASILQDFSLDLYRPIVPRNLDLGEPLVPRAGNLGESGVRHEAMRQVVSPVPGD